MTRKKPAPSAASRPADAPREQTEIEALVLEGEFALARERAERWIREDPDCATAHSLLSRALFYLDLPLRAVESAERACELAITDASMWARLGGVEVAIGRYDAAIAHCRRSLELDAHDASARTNLALALARTGADRAAIEALVPLGSRPSLPSAARGAALALLDELALAPGAAALRAAIDGTPSADRGPSPAALAAVQRTRATYDSVLDRVGRDLCQLAREGKLDRITGRDEELDALVDVLCRKRKSNPCLVGPAGVGKTAIVERLAQRIVEGSVAAPLRRARVIEVSVASLTAGTSLRGELEARLQRLLEEARGDRGIILFLDEVHTLVSANGGAGQLSIAEVLKPAMARGEISLIGATTEEGYERSIQRDPALARRFERISVREPDAASLERMLTSAAEDLAKHHGVALALDRVRAVIELSARWLADRRMPDVGVDVLDRACARAARRGMREVDDAILIEAVAGLARVSVAQLTEAPGDLLARVRESLFSTVLGQSKGSAMLASAFALQALRAPEARRPRAVLWIVGPPSVGKHTALRALARASERPVIEFDLASVAERHDLAKLTGTAAGFVGYDDGAPLLRALRAQPNALVIFDQPELAHPDARALVASAIREGALVDSRGDSADLRRATIAFVSTTSDVERTGFFLGDPRPSPGPRAADASMLGRSLEAVIDETVRFDALDREARRALVHRFVSDSCAQLAKAGAALSVDEAVLDWISERSSSARELRARCERELFADALVDARARRRAVLEDRHVVWRAP